MNPYQIEEMEDFERSFYRAFVTIENNILIRKIWNWDDENKRLKLKNNFDDLVILVWKSPNEILKCGVVANLNTDDTQLGKFGFAFPSFKPKPHCEIVTLFTDLSDRKIGVSLNRHFLKAYCIPYMAEMGYKSLYSTCAEKPLKTYLRWGWELIEEKVIDTEKRYLLYYDIPTNLKNDK
jgi:hypothetical protein